jgi:prevent-host-death family protein
MAREPTVSVAEAKRSFSELLGKVAFGGQSVLILKRGRPMARLVPATGARRPMLAGVKGWLSDDDPFLTAVEEIVAERHSHRPRSLRRRKA